MYQPPQVRRPRYVNVRSRLDPPSTGADRFALAFALFSAFTFMGTLMMMCAVVGIAALLLRSETRWYAFADMLNAQPGAAAITPPAGASPTASPLSTPTLEAQAVQPPASTEAAGAANQPAPIVDAAQQITPVSPESPLLGAATPPNAVQQPPTAANAQQIVTDAQQTPAPSDGQQANTPPANPGATNDEVGILLQYSNNLIDTLQQLSSLAGEPQYNDSNWLNSMQMQLTKVRQSYGEIAALPVQPTLSEVHNTLLNAAMQCNAATYSLETALRDNDPTRFQNGAAQIDECRNAVNDASNEIQARL